MILLKEHHALVHLDLEWKPFAIHMFLHITIRLVNAMMVGSLKIQIVVAPVVPAVMVSSILRVLIAE